MKRRSFLKATAAGGALLWSQKLSFGQDIQATAAPPVNLAVVAKASASYVSPDQSLAGLNSGFDPRSSRDTRHGSYGNWPQTGTQWAEYEWSRPISTNRIDVYWFADGRGIRLPRASRLLYWDGSSFVPVPGAQGLGVSGNRFNATSFPEITTAKLRLEFDSQADRIDNSTGILQWKVYDSGKSPELPPILHVGPRRVAVITGSTYLAARVKTLKSEGAIPVAWSKISGPGDVAFADSAAPTTTATFSHVGDYVLGCTAGTGDLSAADTVEVRVESSATAPPHPVAIHTRAYTINSAFWNPRIKNIIINWIPHCVAQLSKLDLREGGINNFIQAGNRLAGRPYTRNPGYPFTDAFTHNAVESMCLALMIDPQGDQEIIAAQGAMRAKLEEWIPIILGAQEPDGYLQTRFTRDPRNPPHWSPRYRGEHEGYTAGYFIESAIAHYLMTEGKDLRLYNAAKKLADCWDAHLGPPPKQQWYDGHEEIEQALVRFGRLVNEVEGEGKGDRYFALAKFLLDCRGRGDDRTPYDQSHEPVIHQYEAVGHAVRAVYLYSGMTDVVLKTGDVDYQSAVKSIWDNLVNRKYYITGGVGSGETSEGFGPDFSLRNNAYCESCSSCGEIFFQSKMNRAFDDALYADLCEETIYNALLGSLDLEGKNFYYDNPLAGDVKRYPWHVCPCCVGNIPRTLLQYPTWTYTKTADTIYVNHFIGSTIEIGDVAGTAVQMVQETNYPWDGKVLMTVNPASARTFTIRIRSPRRGVSELYPGTPDTEGFESISVNGEAMADELTSGGYVSIARKWTAGDTIELQLPMRPQIFKSDPRVAADKGCAALRYGPLLYTIETADGQDIQKPVQSDSTFTPQWRADLLGGVLVLNGRFADGSPLMAIPNYARANRGGWYTVWMTEA